MIEVQTARTCVRASLTAAFVVLALAATAGAEEWFDAFEKAERALRQGQAVRAASLFERAIELRPDPGTNVVTYGTNHIERYFPYLRLAEAYLQAGQPEKAKDALARSQGRGREPATERTQLAARVTAALDQARAALVPPPPLTTLAAVPPPTAPITTVAAAPTPAPVTTLPAIASPPTTAGAAIALLELRTDPPGATVFDGTRLLGTAPLKVGLNPGSYQITLRREGYAETSFPVRIEAGKPTLVERTLVKALAPVALASPTVGPPETAALMAFSEPSGAHVYLDDESIGPTSPDTGRVVKSGVTPGPHRVRFTLAGRDDIVQQVQVVAAGPTVVRATFPAPANGTDGTLVGGVVLLVVAGGGVLVWRRRRVSTEDAPTRALPVTPRTSRSTAVTPPTQGDGLVELETRAVAPVTPPGTQVSAASQQFGEYRLLEQLGRGGMASVLRAERRGQICALKRPLPALLEDPEFLERFLREAEIGRTLHHHNIIRIFERGEVDGLPYFTMELLQGQTLQGYMRAHGAVPAVEATRVIAQVAEALDYAHLKGVVHRDLKPSNIMILQDGTVKVMDYGIARARRFDGLTATGAFLGTPDYVAPETAEGRGTDARSDLYSLGLIFYEMITGHRPLVGDTPMVTLYKHCHEVPAPPSTLVPDLPPEIELIVMRLLEKKPADRYPGAEELLIALRDFANRAA